MQRQLDYPLGHSVISTTRVRRLRAVPAGAMTRVVVGTQVGPETVLAEASTAGGSVPVLAGIAGTVVEVQPGQGVTIEGTATLLHGVVGVGGPAVGTLAILPRGESLAMVALPRGGLILYPRQLPLTLVQRAAAAGVVGIIAASASAHEIEAFVRADLGQVFESAAPLPLRVPLTLILTEGFGDLTMDTVLYQTLAQRVGALALIDGLTHPRRNVRPEVLLAAPAGVSTSPTSAAQSLGPGDRVRVIAGALRGAYGQVLYLYQHVQQTESGLLVPSARVRLDDASTHTVPLHALTSAS